MSRQTAATLAALVVKSRRVAWNLDDLAHASQLRLIGDPARYVVATTGRRWGKTNAAALKLLDTAVTRKNVLCAYIAASRQSAKGLVWSLLLRLDREFKLGGSINISELTIEFPNGSMIKLVGADTEREVNKLRGLGADKHLAIAIVDESQRFRAKDLRSLVDEVLRPALADIRGALWLIGTPPPALVGPFYDAWKSSKWSHHHATMLDNPYISISAGKPISEVMDEERANLGVTIDAPIWQREWLGKWVEDRESTVYRYETAVNAYTDLPDNLTTYLIGVDIGYGDADAIAVLGWNEDDGKVYLVEEDVVKKQTVTTLGEKLRDLRDAYNPIVMVADSGGVGLKTIETIRQDLDIDVTPAVKPPVVQQIRLVNDALRTGRLLARDDSVFAEDSRLVVWVNGVVGGKVDEKAYHSDICPAVRYAWMAAMPYLKGYEAPPEPEPPIEVRMRQEAERQQRRAAARRMGHQPDEVFEEAVDEGDLWG